VRYAIAASSAAPSARALRRRIPGDRPGKLLQPPAEARAHLFFGHGRIREPHGKAAHHARARAGILPDRHGNAVQARRACRPRERVAVTSYALERNAKCGLLARREPADVAQDGPPLLLRTESEPGPAERADQHRPARVQARFLE